MRLVGISRKNKMKNVAVAKNQPVGGDISNVVIKLEISSQQRAVSLVTSM